LKTGDKKIVEVLQTHLLQCTVKVSLSCFPLPNVSSEGKITSGNSETRQFQPQSFSALGSEVLKVESFQMLQEHHQKSPLLHFFFLLRLVILKAMGSAIAQGWHC